MRWKQKKHLTLEPQRREESTQESESINTFAVFAALREPLVLSWSLTQTERILTQSLSN
jgi:hypothetical protein